MKQCNKLFLKRPSLFTRPPLQRSPSLLWMLKTQNHPCNYGYLQKVLVVSSLGCQVKSKLTIAINSRTKRNLIKHGGVVNENQQNNTPNNNLCAYLFAPSSPQKKFRYYLSNHKHLQERTHATWICIQKPTILTQQPMMFIQKPMFVIQTHEFYTKPMICIQKPMFVIQTPMSCIQNQ